MGPCKVNTIDLPNGEAWENGVMILLMFDSEVGIQVGSCGEMSVSRGEQMCGSMHQYCKLPTQTHPEDVQNRSANPRLIYQLKTRAQKCSVCKIYRASKVVLDDKWKNENQ
ncbi:hypothetical protein YC2023_104762 [Brassica napus]